MRAHLLRRLFAGIAMIMAMAAALGLASASQESASGSNQVLEWNQIFVDTLVATNTPNSSSQRLGAIVHTAIFDAYNGVERRYTPIFVSNTAPPGSSRRAAVIAAAYTALLSLFPSRQPQLDLSYAASLEALSDNGGDGGQSRERGVAWGIEVASAVLAWRASDGFASPRDPFRGGPEVGRWRPTPPAFASMSAQGLAYTSPFVVVSSTQFQPGPPRPLNSTTYTDDFKTVKDFGRITGSARTPEQTALAPFWEGNASVHWNQAANQMARAHDLSVSDTNRLFAVLNLAMADTAFTIWSAKRHYGDSPTEVTWRPVTSIPLADTDGNSETIADSAWMPLVTTPAHPEYPAGHPAQNGAAATVLLGCFDDLQTFTLTTRLASGVDLLPQTYGSISQARTDGNNARVWGGMHYPSTVTISDQVGEAVANYVNENAMQRIRGQQ